MTMTAESNDNRTAAQRALSIPEILAQIFRWIVHRWGLEYRVLPSGARAYQLLYRGRKALLRCGRVNKVWFAEATRYLWQYPANCIENNLSLLLSKVDPERQKFYASLVQIGFMAPLSVNNCAERNRFLDGAEFSRIRLLRLHMWTVRKRLFLPKIQAPGLEVLEIDPSPCANRRYINRRVGLDLAKRIQKRFPRLQKVIFIRYCRTSATTLKFFAVHLPNVEVVWSGYKRLQESQYLGEVNMLPGFMAIGAVL